MRVIDLDNETLQAATDSELAGRLRDYFAGRDDERSDEEIERLVAERAYEATDS